MPRFPARTRQQRHSQRTSSAGRAGHHVQQLYERLPSMTVILSTFFLACFSSAALATTLISKQP